jgi:hypothetical protein
VLIGLLVFTIFMAFILAEWEIQIEGQDGWAAKAPGWRIEKGWLMKISGGRPVTGYHFYMTVFLVALVHLTLFFTAWTWRLECLLLGFYTAMVLIEDFLWFLLNPHFGLKKFRPGQIWWHKTWWGPVPSLYWFLGPLAGVLIWLGSSSI